MSKSRYLLNNVGNLVAASADSAGIRAVAGASAAAVTGFLCARAAVFDGAAPFGIAAVAAAQGQDGILVLVGVVLGYMLPGGTSSPGRYIAAAAAVFLFKWLLAGFKDLIAHPGTGPVCAAAACFVTGMAVVLGNGVTPYDVILCCAETLLCGCSVLFLQKALPFLKNPGGLWGLTQKQLISVTISFCILLLSLSRVTAAGISLGRIAGILAVLVAARYGREAGGSVAGVAVGIVMGFGDKSMAQIAAGYGFGGLIAGVFAPLGRLGCAAAFLLANVVAGLYTGSLSALATGLYEALIAALLFLLLPEKLLARCSLLFVPAGGAASPQGVRRSVAERIGSAAGALEEISHTLDALTVKLRKLHNDDISVVFDRASESTCRHCGMKLFCWETAYNDTMDALNSLTPLLKRRRSLERGDLPRHFETRCCKLGSLLSAINKSYAEYAAQRGAELKTSQLRGVLADQFDAVSKLLRGFAKEFSAASHAQPGGEERVRAALMNCGVRAQEAVSRVDSRGHVTVEADFTAAEKTRVSRAQMVTELSDACGVPLQEPDVVRDGTIIRVRFMQKPAFRVRFGQASERLEGERLCGDACETFTDAGGRAIAVVSDGMGSGGSAAVDSSLAAGFLRRLVSAGFDFDAALSIINSSIMLKSGDESFATLDVACIDLYTGETELLKAGAPPSYLRRCGRVERIAPCSMPAGILRSVTFARSDCRLRRGDMVLVMSDGAVNGDDKWVADALENFRGGDLDEFSQELVRKAKEHRDDGHGDDITVVAALLE